MSDNMNDHTCSQEGTLAKMATQLTNIEEDVSEIKRGQAEILSTITAASIRSAKYPDPELVSKKLTMLERHELYFKIISVALGCAWAVLLLILGVLFQKFFL